MTIKIRAFNLLDEYYYKEKEIPGAKILIDELNIRRRYAYKLLKKWKHANNNIKREENKKTGGVTINKDFKKDCGSLDIRSTTINTLDDALKIANVDLKVWNVERYTINSWQTPMKISTKNGDKTKQVTNFQVKIWIAKKKKNKWEKAIKQLIKTIPSIPQTFNYNYFSNNTSSDNDVAAEIALHDAHFGKFAWHPETLMGNWDLKIAAKTYLHACEKGLENASKFNPSKIFFILGHDFLHVDNTFFKTPHGGNQLDADGRFPKIAKEAMNTILTAVNMCAQYAPVEVKWVPGNHDMNSSYWLSLILEQVYKNNKNVIIDNGPSQRKHILWGNLLVGFWHDAAGRKMNTSVNALAQWWPEEWGKSLYRELHVGHKHKKVQIKTLPIETVGGVIVRQIPSLSSIDYWHHESMFVDAVPAGETLLWSKRDGVFGNFTINIKPEK